MKPKKTANFSGTHHLKREVGSPKNGVIQFEEVPIPAILRRQQTERPSTRIIEEDELDDETSIAATSHQPSKLLRSKTLTGKSCMGERPDYSEINSS
jgi:hypothetical protein